MGDEHGTVAEKWVDRGRVVRAAVLVALGALVPRLLTVAHDTTVYDEGIWRDRSYAFSDAVLSARFGDASASAISVRLGRVGAGTDGVATMPGITTMWLGSAARGVWASGRDLGLWARSDSTFTAAPSALDAAQAAVAVTCAALVGLLVVLVARWLGLVPAVVAGVIVGTEPFLVAHGSVFHTDELLSLFGVAGLVATALALGVPRATPWQGRPGVATLAGGLLAAAVLTKLSALVFLVSALLLAVWAVAVALREPDRPASWWAATGGLWRSQAWLAGAAVAVVLVTYPALWVDPLHELTLMRRSAGLAGEGQMQFFLGEPTDNPGPAYYLVVMPLRVTPWFLVAGVAAAVVLWARASCRATAAALTCMAAPCLVVVSLASKQMDRYSLPVLVVGAIAVGAAAPPVVGAARDRLTRWSGRRRLAESAGAAVAVLLVAHATLVAPWGIAYFNPLLGGSDTAERAILVGWGEGLEGAGPLIARHSGGACQDVTVGGYLALAGLSCGQPVAATPEADYLAIYVSERQRMAEDDRTAMFADRPLVGERTVRGIAYIQVYGPVSTTS